MSGIKDVYVTMTRAKRDKLRNSVRRAEESERLARQREESARRALDASNAKVETLNRALNREIAGLHSEMRNMANEQNRRLREQAAENQRRLAQQAAAFNNSIDDVNKRMEDQRKALENSINDVREQTETNRRELQNSINNISAKIEAKENSHKKIAEFWISQTQVFFDDISQYRHEMFTPGQLARLKTELNQMLSDLNNEMYQSATSSARGIFNRAVDLKETVVSAENEWACVHGLFMQALADAESNLNRNQNLQFTFDLEQGKENIDAKIDYWTDGALSAVSGKILQIKQKTDNIDQVSTQELYGLIDSLNQLNIDMEEAADKAKEAILASQLRADVAQCMAETLRGHGWECEFLVYENDEYNAPVRIKLSDGNGNEIVTIIPPDMKMEQHFFNSNNDPVYRDKLIGSIYKSINDGFRESGINMGKPVCKEGYEDRSSDNEAVRNIQTTSASYAK